MTEPQRTRLLKIGLNALGFLVALWFVYHAGLNILKLYAYRSLASNPLHGILIHDVPIALIGLVACWVCFRTIENLWKLIQ
jgi:hypothetical protein